MNTIELPELTNKALEETLSDKMFSLFLTEETKVKRIEINKDLEAVIDGVDKILLKHRGIRSDAFIDISNLRDKLRKYTIGE